MVDRQMYAETDPRHHTIKLRICSTEVINVREDVTKVSEPKAEALFKKRLKFSRDVLHAL